MDVLEEAILTFNESIKDQEPTWLLENFQRHELVAMGRAIYPKPKGAPIMCSGCHPFTTTHHLNPKSDNKQSRKQPKWSSRTNPSL
jgi:hypothetical protein